MLSKLRTTPAPATLDDRLNGASALAAFALSSFEDAANDLEAAALEQESVRLAAYAEADRYDQLARDARVQRDSARNVAAKIRALVSA